MILLDRTYGQNYADNLIDYLLTFNETSTWTAASGTGTATRDLDNPYQGAASLKLNNTAPTTNLVATNAVQSSAIPFGGTYQISGYFKKAQPLVEISGAMLIYKNAVLLATEEFSIGSDVADDDVDDTWVRFQTSNNYNFVKGDVITFQFRLDGIIGTLLTDTDLWVDGLMINNAERQDFAVPVYVPPTAPINTGTGWAQYLDTTFTVGSPLAIAEGVTATFTNNADTIISPQLPVGVSGFFNSATQRITPATDGDAYNISLRFKAKANALNSYFDVKLDIGGGLGVISQESCIFTRGIGVEQRFDVDMTVFSAATFVTNGGTLSINAIEGSLEIYDINFLIVRTHKAR